VKKDGSHTKPILRKSKLYGKKFYPQTKGL